MNDEMTTLTITKEVRKKLGQYCGKDETFSEYIESLIRRCEEIK